MAMKDYWVNDYGMLLNEDTGRLLCEKIYGEFDFEEHSWEYALYEEGICEYISEFAGEAVRLDSDGQDDWYHSQEFGSFRDVIAYIPLSVLPSLFRKSYNNMEEIISELKAKVGKYLPDNFNYRDSIYHIMGTYFG